MVTVTPPFNFAIQPFPAPSPEEVGPVYNPPVQRFCVPKIFKTRYSPTITTRYYLKPSYDNYHPRVEVKVIDTSLATRSPEVKRLSGEN